MSKLIACSLGALLLAVGVPAAFAQSLPQGMPQNLQQLQSGQWWQQNGQNGQFNQNGQNGQFNQQGENGQNGQMGQNGQNGQQQASNGSKRQRQRQQNLTEEQKMIQQYVPKQYQGYLPADVTGAGGGGMGGGGMSQ
jgi:hypothetical protein